MIINKKILPLVNMYKEYLMDGINLDDLYNMLLIDFDVYCKLLYEDIKIKCDYLNKLGYNSLILNIYTLYRFLFDNSIDTDSKTIINSYRNSKMNVKALDLAYRSLYKN